MTSGERDVNPSMLAGRGRRNLLFRMRTCTLEPPGREQKLKEQGRQLADNRESNIYSEFSDFY